MSINDLKNLVSEYQSELSEWQKNADEVIGKYGVIFAPHNLHELNVEQFHSFLLYKNNKHWHGIHRQSGFLTEDMSNLRKVLRILLDKSRPIADRLNEVFAKGKNRMIKGLGRAVTTPILQVVYPDEYGVYNQKGESALKALGLFPDFPKGTTFAEEYIAINKILLHLADELGISLWQLDTLWHIVHENSGKEDGKDNQAEDDINSSSEPNQLTHFSLERHLSDFLYRNWDKTDLGKEYDLYDEGKDPAQEYGTDIGRIDLLARDVKNKTWVVIELKRNRSSDQVVGQILRYMGWVQANLANNGESVRGLIILGESDDKIRYALEAANADIRLYLYNINFMLKQVN